MTYSATARNCGTPSNETARWRLGAVSDEIRGASRAKCRQRQVKSIYAIEHVHGMAMTGTCGRNTNLKARLST